MEKIVKVYISPSKGNQKISSWEDKIKENYSALSGYLVDLNNGKNIDSILLDLLQLKIEGMVENQNYWNIRGIYLEHVRSLQKNLKEEDDTLKQEISTLESTTPSQKTVEILKKYGILSGIEFFIPYEKTYKEYVDIMGEDVFKGVDTEAPYKKYWDDTFKDSKYIPAKETPFKYKDLKLGAQVLIFSKSKFKLYDVTNFLSNINTSVNIESGGNFNLKMHLFSQDELEQGENFQDNNLNITGYTKALFIQSIFRENDLVFIRFENLQCETDTDIKEIEYDDSIPYAQAKRERRYKKSDKKIKGKYWDMIGLIDSTSIMSDYNSIDITVSGRDLIKLVIDDNNFFIPVQWANNPDTVFGGGNSKGVLKRLYTGYMNEFVRSFKSIENSIGFIFSQLTHIEVLSGACLEFLKKEYGDDLSKQYTYSQAGKKEEKTLTINGVWGLVNFYVDEKISHLRLADASLKSPDGSTMQQIYKICQAPFVEIIADTFVDKYNFIIRRPPFTIEEISKQKFLVIGRDSSIRDNLEFSREIYTVYQLNPQGGFFADNSSIALSVIPMVVLDDYTRLWGNKLYSQNYSYINIDTYNQLNNEEKKQTSIIEIFIDALIWLIETTAYLPFSRTGQITIRGDRRIKVGQWIYYEKTNEVFYVNAVSHSASIVSGEVNRVTTLNVSRGLVKDYVKSVKKEEGSMYFAKKDSSQKYGFRIDSGKKIKVSDMSYADLVDIDLLREGLKELFIKMNINKGFSTQRVVKEGDTFESNNSLVISEVFNFFLSGAQFEGKVNPYVLYYNKPAITLSEIEREQGRAGNRDGYSMSMNFDEINEGGGIENKNKSSNLPNTQRRVEKNNSQKVKKVLKRKIFL